MMMFMVHNDDQWVNPLVNIQKAIDNHHFKFIISETCYIFT